MSLSVISGVLSASVADAGTFTASYPDGKDEGDFYGAHGHKLTLSVSGYGGDLYSFPGDFGITLGTSNITVTNKSGTTWASGLNYRLQLEEQGDRQYRADAPNTKELVASAVKAPVVLINLGAPDVLDADGIAVAQAVAGAGNLSLAGALTSGGVATFDKPRGVQAVSTGAGDTTQTLTFTGTDVYGNAVVETITLNGTTPVLGKKAFKTVTQIAVSAATAGNVSAGSSDVLGLPVFLPETGLVLKELQDGAAATAGTLVAGDLTSGGATATTGDIRGTYDPNAACDGAKVFQLVVALPDAGFIGISQYAG